MQQSSKQVVAELLNQWKPSTILDAPCGGGWLKQRLNYPAEVDGIDLYATPAAGYRRIIQADLDDGIPTDLPLYDCVVCCEGIEHFGSPDYFLRTAKRHLKPGGRLLVTTPNVWYPAARLQYFTRGFFPGFPCLVGRIQRGSHMHITPWSYPHLYLYLSLNTFEQVTLYEEPLSAAKHWFEKLLAWPQKLYCRSKYKKAQGEERRFWHTAMSAPSLYGRHLIVSCINN